MSASNEWWDWHLTPDGWVEGSEKLDFSELKEKEVPANRVLTIRHHERMSSPFSKLEVWASEEWRHPDNNLVTSLIEKYGMKD